MKAKLKNNKKKNDSSTIENDEFIKNIDEFLEQQRHQSKAMKRIVKKLGKRNDQNQD